MSNYSKYLQASFLPLRLPVAEALWNIEKDWAGKMRHTSYRESGSEHTHKIGCLALFMNFMCKQQKKLCLGNTMSRDIFREYSRNIRTLQASKVNFELKHGPFDEHSFMNTFFF